MSEATRPPVRIETARCVLRPWDLADAARLKRALDLSVDHLHPWISWSQREPYELSTVQGRIERQRAEFAEGTGFDYGVFDLSESEVVGGAGLYARIGPAALELGYWILAERVGRGLATEVARALTTAAFDTPGIDRIEMHIDDRNAASLRLPGKLGFHYRETIVDPRPHPSNAADPPRIRIYETHADRRRG